ncbi:MAG: DUF1996 domain-containing protein [Microthrixaceae bacterium]
MSHPPLATLMSRTRWAALATVVSLSLVAGCGGSTSQTSSGAERNGWGTGEESADGGAAMGESASGPFASAESPVPARHTGPQGSFGQFVTDCALSHTAADDPIVYPAVGGSHSDSNHGGAHGEPGTSHLHNFFGNVSTDSASTLESLLGAGTTCQKKLDKAAYWSPALYDHGNLVEPTTSTAYYRVAPGVAPKAVQAFPPGLKIIAGDSNATEPQSADLAGWGCGTSTIQSPTPQDCPVSAPLRSVITFPDCWDGVNTDSEDHRSHMTNSTDGLCPASHPVHVPQLTFAISYPIFGPGHDLTLASGPVESLHSDFINAWHQDSLEQEIRLCLRRDVTCSLSSNRGEEFLFEGY